MKKKLPKCWVLDVVEEDGVLVITLPPDAMKSVKWKIGDRILWIPDGNGYLLKKVEVKQSRSK